MRILNEFRNLNFVNMVNMRKSDIFKLFNACIEWIFFICRIVLSQKRKENRRQHIKIIIIQDYWPFAVVIFTLDKRGKLPCKSHRMGFSLWETNISMNEDVRSWFVDFMLFVLVYFKLYMPFLNIQNSNTIITLLSV